ncbi:MAG: HAMP domain-containing sensor histidine kinase [Rhodospirillaceae bacterium]
MKAWLISQGREHDGAVIVLCTILTFAIFCLDLGTTADNVSVGFVYDGVIFLTFLVRHRQLSFSYAAVASVLVVVGCFFPLPAREEMPVFFANRLLAIGSLWLIALLIHYRSHAEAALVKLLDASELASEAKSRFLASMSHELRAPLTGILGFSEILKSEMLGPLGNRRYVDYAGHIHESGEHMLSLINDILDIAKIEAGKMEIDPEWVGVPSLFEHLEGLIAVRAAERGLTLIFEAPPALQLFADARAARQMVINLLSNALKFTPDGGLVTVTARSGADGGIMLAVSDTGPGICHETITRLMRPFEQADNRFDASRKGSGLGLSLVKGLMELHGGRLTIESTVGRGSIFTLHFPPPPPGGADRPPATAAG